MQTIHRSFFAIVVLAAISLPPLRAQTSSNQPAPAQVVDAMRRTSPNYPVPYGPTTVEAVTAVLNRIHAYLDANSPARLINRDTRAEITDLSKPDPAAALDRGQFAVIGYEWGVTYSGMLLATETTGDPRFKDYVAKRLQFVVDKTPYFRSLETGGGTGGPFRSVLHPGANRFQRNDNHPLISGNII